MSEVNERDERDAEKYAADCWNQSTAKKAFLAGRKGYVPASEVENLRNMIEVIKMTTYTPDQVEAYCAEAREAARKEERERIRSDIAKYERDLSQRDLYDIIFPFLRAPEKDENKDER